MSFYKNATDCTFNGKTIPDPRIKLSCTVHAESPFLTRSLKTSLCASHLQYEHLSEVNEGLWWPERLKCTKTTYKIDLLGRDHKEATGALPYRIAAWERDFVQYSNQYSSYFTFLSPLLKYSRHPNLVHLYGFNRQKSNVVPLMQAWEDCSPIVKLFIHYSVGPSEEMPSDLRYGGYTSGTSGTSLPFSLYYDEAGLKRYIIERKNPPVLTPLFTGIFYSYCLNDFTSTESTCLPSVLLQGHDGLRQKLIGSFKNMDQSYSYTLEPWRCDLYDNGKLLGTGWTRFHYESYIGKEFQLLVHCSPEATQRIYNAWFHQKYYLNVVKEDAFDQFGKQISCLKKDWCPESGSAEHEAAKYIQECQGFDPLTQDYARACEFPLIEMLSPLEHFHPNDLAEENQEALDAWYDAEETLSKMSGSESVYEDASSQLQRISDDSDLGSLEGDSLFNGESDDPASQALELNPSLGSALIAGCKPSSWLGAYLIQENITSWMDFAGGLIPTSQTPVVREYTPFVGFVPNVSIWIGIKLE
ncbi:hypothetical protein K435DRAFT_799581 [Dendrothele bispora CBS 962.96]|uniref:Uncharacterized protein n=1 Tax=Dendrothele bispora (strain CBS 962.96) TaxID=1314807 RepID=A0A4V4HF47_DENBC|nr:hypothetical protein K435DRAFT_799581 [Dendrothele bispora CBS 962.96]